MPMNDNVNHPAHYTDGKYEVIDFIEEYKLPFHLANTVKYICRAGKKDPEKTVEDLRKARWYLNRFVKYLDNYNIYSRMTAFILRDIDFESEMSIFHPNIPVLEFCEDKNLTENLFNAVVYITDWVKYITEREDIRAYLELTKAQIMLDREIEGYGNNG